jgi:hypothetical protein
MRILLACLTSPTGPCPSVRMQLPRLTIKGIRAYAWCDLAEINGNGDATLCATQPLNR